MTAEKALLFEPNSATTRKFLEVVAPRLQTHGAARQQAASRGDPAAYVNVSHADYMARFYHQVRGGREGGGGEARRRGRAGGGGPEGAVRTGTPRTGRGVGCKRGHLWIGEQAGSCHEQRQHGVACFQMRHDPYLRSPPASALNPYRASSTATAARRPSSWRWARDWEVAGGGRLGPCGEAGGRGRNGGRERDGARREP